MIVSSTYQSGTLITVVVNTSNGGSGSWFWMYSPASDASTTSAITGVSNSLSWGGRVKYPDELDDYTVRSLKILESVIQLIIGYIAVGACVKHPLLPKSCCY